ncbi:hypothetical protein [Bacillus swezeyi]|uniref:MarR family transcriptional regulator n=1 Tax=Bacillus swezeyi TaxID=1925020 RepID=A0A5M8RJ62_9BACI|nr:hypothetical protein [Bacillus swezeyi]KAA6446906.1 hypothetical protein DX927_22905 [Bacillus swezeyi]KAA6471474.1 hypothetical protein DX928_23145 [Bacillus swezeyi]
MDASLNEKYKQIKFNHELTELFTDIVVGDPVLRRVLVYISSSIQKKKKSGISHNFYGVTIQEITENVEIERPKRVQKGKRVFYENQLTNIETRAAGRAVEKLSAMSLIYHENVPPYKVLYITHRGLQVISELINRKNKGDEYDG